MRAGAAAWIEAARPLAAEALEAAAPDIAVDAGRRVCEVEIDPETGVVRLVRPVAVDDMGTVINPLIVEGQLHGGIAQGIGQALLEFGVDHLDMPVKRAKVWRLLRRARAG